MCPYNAMLRRQQRALEAAMEKGDVVQNRNGRRNGPRQSDASHDFRNYGLNEDELAEHAWENEGGAPSGRAGSGRER